MPTLNTTIKTNGNLRMPMPLTKKIPEPLMEEIKRAISSINGYGSIEIYVQDHSVTQITTRNITKIKHDLA